MTHATPPGHDPFGPGQPPPGRQGNYNGPGYPQQDAPKPKRKVWPWVLGGVVLLVLVCGGIGVALLAAGGKAVNDAVQEADANNKGLNAVEGKVGEPATDGSLQFTVHKLKCGVGRVGDPTFGVDAQGQFCLLDITVKNVGKASNFYDGTSQKVYDAKGSEYAHDSNAAGFVNQNAGTFLEQINPGNTAKGTLVFDVPKNVKITKVVLHDSMLSPGVSFAF
jgi:hypothetical protein